MRTQLWRTTRALPLHSLISCASTPRWRSAGLAVVGILCAAVTLLPSSAGHARSQVLPPQVVAQVASSSDSARQRALDALERGGSHTNLPSQTNLDHAPIQARERSIPRKIDVSKLPSLGCTPRDPSARPLGACGGCGGCPGEVTPSNLSTTAQRNAALLGIAALLAIGMMIRHIWVKRVYPTHRELAEHELLDEARALSPTAIDDALAAKDYTAAVHAVFLRTLLKLNAHDIQILKGWTPREIPPSIALSPPMREQLSALVLLAEQARFADHRSSEEEFELAARTADLIDEYLDTEHA